MVMSPTTRRHDHVRESLHPRRNPQQVSHCAALRGTTSLSRALRTGGCPAVHVARDCGSSGQPGPPSRTAGRRSRRRDPHRGRSQAMVAARRAPMQPARGGAGTAEIRRPRGAMAALRRPARRTLQGATRPRQRGRSLRSVDAYRARVVGSDDSRLLRHGRSLLRSIRPSRAGVPATTAGSRSTTTRNVFARSSGSQNASAGAHRGWQTGSCRHDSIVVRCSPRG